MAKTYAIHGIPVTGTRAYPEGTPAKDPEGIPYIKGLPLRREITEVANPQTEEQRKQWTLFVLALEQFKSMSVQDRLSYFQIAGIHSSPETPWDEDRKHENGPGQYIYCSHNTIGFPTWHRIYMLLFEQRIWEIMTEIINGGSLNIDESSKAEWIQAATTWRLPYWDWARKQHYNNNFAVPNLFTRDTVTIWLPNGVEQNNYPNPFWSFQNPEVYENGNPRPFGHMPPGKTEYNISNAGSGEFIKPWAEPSATSRYGITSHGQYYHGLEGINNFTAANQALANDHQFPFLESSGTLSDAVNRLLSSSFVTTWEKFASTKWHENSPSNQPTSYLSVETIHNTVHNLTGGSNLKTGLGHMADVPVAAFDPLFWLHHCQVDRLVAIWQALNWELWWTDESPTCDVQETDPLKPFHVNEEGGYWTSNMCRDWTQCRYQYDTLDPDTACLNEDGTLNEFIYLQWLRREIDSLYPGTDNVINTLRTQQPIPNLPGLYTPGDTKWKDYVINVVYDRYALKDTSYSIEFYIDAEQPDGGQIYTSENLIGLVVTFNGPIGTNDGPGCENCAAQAEANVLSRSQFSITLAILQHILGQFNSGNQANVENHGSIADYIKAKVSWRFIQFGGKVVPHECFPNTKVSILKGEGALGDRLRGGENRGPAKYEGYEEF
ncbi:hypothetical protein V8C35DRAFT_295919 [Trichoderma chlorosporum]